MKKRVRPDTPETVRIKAQNARRVMDAAREAFGPVHMKATLTRPITDAMRAALLAPPREPTPRELAQTRALAGLPIDNARELVHNLLDLRDRIPSHTGLWFFMNGLIRAAMDRADTEERKPK